MVQASSHMPGSIHRQSRLAFTSKMSNFREGLLLFIVILSFLLPLQVGAQSVQSPGDSYQVELKDIDGDGNQDVIFETAQVRLALSSVTGNLIVYYLKGRNFEENLYPPILLDLGYPIASDSLMPFKGFVGGKEVAGCGYSLEVEKQADKVLVVATANQSAQNLGDSGVALSKRYTFPARGYSFEIAYVVSNLGEHLIEVGDEKTPGIELGYGPGIFLDPFGPAKLLGLKPGSHQVFSSGLELTKASAAGGFTGAGLKTTYFCMLLDAKEPVHIVATDVALVAPDKKKKKFNASLINVQLPSFTLKPKGARSFSFHIYYGPKLLDELKPIGREKITDYGFLSTMLLRILQFFNSIIPNYGLSIVFLTLLIRILLYPLTLKSTRNMAEVQKVQPLVQDLKDRYKDEPQKFQEEVMKLYQKHNVNPLGGCLPMLLQLPILIAIYNTIRIAVELRKTPFLWMSDLSKADPLLILPITIAALMYYQQGKSTADAQARQMMAFMPVFMFVITWSLPAGLLIYWFTSSIVGIIQQIQANKITAAAKEE